MLDAATLKTLIISDPYSFGTKALVSVAEGGTGTVSRDGDILALLNTPTASGNCPQQAAEPVPRWKVKNYLITTGKLLPLLADATHESAQMAKALFADPDFGTIDMVQGGWQTLVAALEAEQFITSGDATAIAAFGLRSGSPAEAVFGAGVVATVSDVSYALRGKT